MADFVLKAGTGDTNRLMVKDQAGGEVLTTLKDGAYFQSKSVITNNITIPSGYSAMIIGPVNLTGTVAVNGNLSIV